MKRSTIKHLSLATTALALFSAGVAVSADEATAVVAEAVQTQTSSELKPAAGEAGVASTASSEAATSESNSQATATSEAATEATTSLSLSVFQQTPGSEWINIITTATEPVSEKVYADAYLVSQSTGWESEVASVTINKDEAKTQNQILIPNNDGTYVLRLKWDGQQVDSAPFSIKNRQFITTPTTDNEVNTSETPTSEAATSETSTSETTKSETSASETAKSETSASETAKSETATKTSSSLNLDQLANGDLSSIVGKYPGKNGGNSFTFNPDGTVTIESENAKWTETASDFRNNNGIIEFSSVDAPTRFYIVPAGVASPIDAGLARFDDINRDRIFITGEGSNIVFLDEKLGSEKVDNNSKTTTTDTASSSNDKVDTNTTQAATKESKASQAAAKTNTTASKAAVAQTPTQSSKKLPSTGEQNTIFAAFVGAILLAGAAILAKVKFLKK